MLLIFCVRQMSQSMCTSHSAETFEKQEIRIQNTDLLATQQEIHESYLLHLNYFNTLVSNHGDLIEKVLLREKQKDWTDSLIRSLVKMRVGFMDSVTFFREEQVQDYLRVIKEKMNIILASLSKSEKDFYLTVLNQYKLLQKSLIYNAKIIQSEMTIDKLFYLDVFSLILHETVKYIKCCKASFRNITQTEINYLFGFPPAQAYVLTSVYKKYFPFLVIDIDSEIHELVIIFHMIRIRNRTVGFYYRLTKEFRQFPENIINKMEIKELTSNNDEQIRYRFCQVPFTTLQKSIQKQSYRNKCEIIQSLYTAIKSGERQTIRRNILQMKIKFSLSFSSVFAFKELIQKQQIPNLEEFLENGNQAKKQQDLTLLFNNMFVNNCSFDEAFEKFSLMKKYNLKNFDRAPKMLNKQIDLFEDLAFRQYQLHQVLVTKMLKIQHRKRSNFIFISRMTISYNELKILTNKQNQKKDKDIIGNLILITDQTSVKFIGLLEGKFNCRQYINFLKNALKIIQNQGPFIIVLKEFDMENLIMWEQFNSLSSFVQKQLRSKILATNMIKYFDLHLRILALTCVELSLIEHLVNDQNFLQIALIASARCSQWNSEYLAEAEHRSSLDLNQKKIQSECCDQIRKPQRGRQEGEPSYLFPGLKFEREDLIFFKSVMNLRNQQSAHYIRSSKIVCTKSEVDGISYVYLRQVKNQAPMLVECTSKMDIEEDNFDKNFELYQKIYEKKQKKLYFKLQNDLTSNRKNQEQKFLRKKKTRQVSMVQLKKILRDRSRLDIINGSYLADYNKFAQSELGKEGDAELSEAVKFLNENYIKRIEQLKKVFPQDYQSIIRKFSISSPYSVKKAHQALLKKIRSKPQVQKIYEESD